MRRWLPHGAMQSGQERACGRAVSGTVLSFDVEGARLGPDLGDAQLMARYQRWRSLDTFMVAAAISRGSNGVLGVLLRDLVHWAHGLQEQKKEQQPRDFDHRHG